MTTSRFFIALAAIPGLLLTACASTQQNSTSVQVPSAIQDSSGTAKPKPSNPTAPRPMGSGKLTVAPKHRDAPPGKVTGRSQVVADRDRSAAQATIGAPETEAARSAAVVAFDEGVVFMGNHAWTKAANSFRIAIRNDGSVAKYHASLGQVLMVHHQWLDAQAAYTAAVLLDLDNPEYQRQLKKARSSR